MKLFLLVTLLWLAPTPAQAEHDGLLCQPVGLAPDRFFSHTGKGTFTQFATKKNSVSPLVNRVVKSSTLKLEHLTGGASLTWSKGGKTTNYSCGRD